MSKAKAQYVGRSGHLAVMAEFLARGYNVAIPEVDRGDDIFVVEDSSGELARIQVKTGSAKKLPKRVAKRFTGHSYSATFKVGLKQLSTPKTPDLYYVLVVRTDNGWGDFVVIERKRLEQLHASSNVGSTADNGKSILLKLQYTTAVMCGSENLSLFRNQWSKWPPIEP